MCVSVTAPPILPHAVTEASTVEYTRLEKVLCLEDSLSVDRLLKLPVDDSLTSNEVFQPIMFPIQAACTNLKRLGESTESSSQWMQSQETYGKRTSSGTGGRWWGNAFDGHKYICVDDFVGPSASPCLIYSFGIGDDVTFEEHIIKFGCEVHGYDHTISMDLINQQAQPHKNFFINQLGLAVQANESLKLTSFADELRKHGHLNREITYLKVSSDGLGGHPPPSLPLKDI